MKPLFTLPVTTTDPNSESDTVNDTTIETRSKPTSPSVLVDMKDYVHVHVRTGWYEHCAWESVGMNKNNVRIDYC